MAKKPKKLEKFSITFAEGDDLDTSIKKVGDVWKALMTAKLRYIGIKDGFEFVMHARPVPGKTIIIRPRSKTKKEKR